MIEAAARRYIHDKAIPAKFMIAKTMTNTKNVNVYLKKLLNAPIGQMYLHQNIFIKKFPKMNRAIDNTAIHRVSSPWNPVAAA